MEQVNTELLHCVTTFAHRMSQLFKDVFDVDFSLDKCEIINKGLNAENKFFVSILFTGTAYGEYVLAINEDIAAKLVGSNERSDLQDTFSELLNTAVGVSILEIGGPQKKLTMTAPKVYFGKVQYPAIKTGLATLNSSIGGIDCYFYIDRMKLDIASSYSGALESLEMAHKDLQEAMEKLKRQQSWLVQTEKLAALGTMAAGVAHEINTPLAIVRLAGDQLKMMAQEPQQDHETFLKVLDTVDNTINRITRITNGMRLFAQSARNGTFEPVAVNDIINDALLLCEKSIKNKNVDLQYDEKNSDMSCECRISEIVQALANVIANACDAIATLPQKWVKLEVIDKGPHIEISVTDSGQGISSNIADKIFDPFFTTRDVGSGTGLGLSIAKGIMGSHHGSIVVDKTSPHTRFVLSIPKNQTAKTA